MLRILTVKKNNTGHFNIFFALNSTSVANLLVWLLLNWGSLYSSNEIVNIALKFVLISNKVT